MFPQPWPISNKKNNDTKFTNVQSNKKYLIKGWREQMKRENSEVQELRKWTPCKETTEQNMTTCNSQSRYN
jgi:hypothetical protein